jgi:hypothetical protein
MPRIGAGAYNMLDFVKGDNSDEGAAIQTVLNNIPAGSTVFWPAGHTYNCGTTSLDLGEKCFRMVGGNASHVTKAPPSRIYTNVGSPLFKNTSVSGQLNGYEFHRLHLENDHASGTVLSLESTQAPCSVIDCHIESAFKGAEFTNSNFVTLVLGTTFKSSGNPVGGYGLYTSGHATVVSCNFVSWDEGVRASGVGLHLAGCRFEVNLVGMLIGNDEAGTNTNLTAWGVRGTTFEANDTGIYLVGGGSGCIDGISMTGTSGSPSAGSLLGIDIDSGTSLAIRNSTVTGAYATNGIRLNAVTGFCSFKDVKCTSTSGAAWNIAADSGVVFENCNTGNVVLAFTDADATPDVFQSTVGGTTFFKTANTGSTTITDFDNGLTGIPFTLRFADANTTVTHGTNIFLKGGVTKLYSSGEVTRFVELDDGNWYEL